MTEPNNIDIKNVEKSIAKHFSDTPSSCSGAIPVSDNEAIMAQMHSCHNCGASNDADKEDRVDMWDILEGIGSMLEQIAESGEFEIDENGDLVVKDEELKGEQSPGKVFTIFGWSGSGKTTFLQKVVAQLSERGMIVGVIKHHGHTSPMDVPGKDSNLYAEAGARTVVVSSNAEYMVHRSVQQPRTLQDLVAEIEPECDIVLVEGFRQQAINPIEFCRENVNEQPIADQSQLVALITDSRMRQAEAEEYGVATFELDDAESFATFLISAVGWEN